MSKVKCKGCNEIIGVDDLVCNNCGRIIDLNLEPTELETDDKIERISDLLLDFPEMDDDGSYETFDAHAMAKVLHNQSQFECIGCKAEDTYTLLEVVEASYSPVYDDEGEIIEGQDITAMGDNELQCPICRESVTFNNESIDTTYRLDLVHTKKLTEQD